KVDAGINGEPQSADADSGVRSSESDVSDGAGRTEQVGSLRSGEDRQGQLDGWAKQGGMAEVFRIGQELGAGADKALRANGVAAGPVLGQSQNGNLSGKAQVREALDGLLDQVAGARIALAPALAKTGESGLGIGADRLVLPRQEMEK